MAFLTKNFPNTRETRYRSLFANETLIRQNRASFRQHTLNILKRRNAIVSQLAFELYIPLAQQDDPRKDSITPREQHEESHVDSMDKLLICHGESWVIPKKGGSVDAVFAAIILHDGIEDLGLTATQIRQSLESGINELFQKQEISLEQYNQADFDIGQTVHMVELLSRKDENGERLDGDRIRQAKEWIEHPYCTPIKMIDWCNKLQTIVGVDSFEQKGQEKLGITLDETALLFVNEQQGIVKKAIELYPELKVPCEPLDETMAMLFQVLRTYKTVTQGKLEFDPKEGYPFDFRASLKHSLKFLRALAKGNNYIDPMITRLEERGHEQTQNNSKDTRITDYVETMVKPSFPNFDVQLSVKLRTVFRATVCRRAYTLWQRLSGNNFRHHP